MVRHRHTRWPAAAGAVVVTMTFVAPVHADEPPAEVAPEVAPDEGPVVAVGLPPVPSVVGEGPVVAVGLPPVPPVVDEVPPVVGEGPVVAVGLPPVPPPPTRQETQPVSPPDSTAPTPVSPSTDPGAAVSAPDLPARAWLVTLLAGRHVLDHCR